ncbi:glycosyltransferase [Bradyrhizobium sp. sGM-13]|uniref:CgeB family protein n=1 Tax=Bradyrhizobium sp. sGM-13 TaxID=2831781 RepID=UPI001BD0114A|nr:glycosyltransferase [Bradyrhizobium sp. sGM-13]
MKFVMFYHSFVSCWNHGNAHFLRGIARELLHLGHQVTIYEPCDGWSRLNALRDGGEEYLRESAQLVPGTDLRTYDLATLELDQALDDADVVVVHEWNDPSLIEKLGARRRNRGRFLLLFHDTHHRAATASSQIGNFQLGDYDAILAFGEVLQQLYQRLGWGRRAFTWHEAADVALFRPQSDAARDIDLIWIGNWGDDERDQELQEFLVQPAVEAGLRTQLFGVRYPDDVREQLRTAGIEFRGWLPNHRAPDAFARARMTIHVPRRPYVEKLPGIPTIRVFEALACGIPLVSAPWNDAEGLFPPESFVTVKNGRAAAAALRALVQDQDFAAETARRGLAAIHARHTCAHRAQELLRIIEVLGGKRNPARADLSRATEQMVSS